MIQNFKKILYVLKVLKGLEDYKISNDITTALWYKILNSNNTMFEFRWNSLWITPHNKPTLCYKHQSLNKTCPFNEFVILKNEHILNIASYNAGIKVLTFSDVVGDITDLCEEENHFQYSTLYNLPTINELKDIEEIEKILLHENIGYYGSSYMLDEDYDRFLKDIKRNLPDAFFDYWKSIGL